MTREIHERYHGYLKTSFYFRDPELRRSFENALDRGQLVKGPFLESTPVYRRKTPTKKLLTELLGGNVDVGFAASLDPDRMLYVHQERAIRCLAEGRNVVVATGTGSGKTEAYLIPILLALYRESLAGERTPGVRALILYPMNALANDQRRRLGELAKRLEENGSRFSFTFGRYTGETPKHQRDPRRNPRQHLEDRNPGELVLRSEMWTRPPDILLTNYSMLEYLLLRPDDSPLFDDGRGASWRFCVLDEAHLYRGTKGMEMAMLLRRLKQRLRDGGLNRNLQCVATSATLGSGEENRAGLARFAQDLLGEPFTEAEVILEEIAKVSSQGSVRLSADNYAAISRTMDSDPSEAETKLRDLASQQAIPLSRGSNLQERLQCLLTADVRVSRLRELLSTPQDVQEAANSLFGELPDNDRVEALKHFLHLVTSTQDSDSGTPLLSLRYHLFLRALEGAFVSCWPAKRVELSRGQSGETSGQEGPRGSWFEVALCRECGQHYFVGRRDNGYLREALRDYGNDEFTVSFFRPIDGEENGNEARNRSRLCAVCGAISRPSERPADPACGHDSVIDVVEEPLREAAEDQVRTCGACGYRGPDPIREIVHGNDGPNAVVATALHRSLPKDRRKILGFVDGRQEAAFFAWYLERSYESILGRNLLLACARALSEEGYKEVSLGTLATRLMKELRKHEVIPASADDLKALRDAWKLVFREFVTDEPRISLEGVGLVRWFPILPSDLRTPDSLSKPPWSLEDTEARDLFRWLLDSIRTDFAVELRADRGVNLSWDDLGLNASQSRVEIGGGRNVKAWDGPRTRRVGFLTRVLATCEGAPASAQEKVEAAQQVLREMWEAFKGAGGEQRLLIQVADARRADPAWWRLRIVESVERLYRCETCGRYQTLSVRAVCARHACPGTLSLVSAADQILASNHYRFVYQQALPARLRAEEHTAQIEREKARTFQEDFEKGRIHFLSCSTTFELGVDLGDLDAIFLRNVPPEPFNYAQRVGRAGRRPARPGFAVTYCRRRPHDLAHFQDPRELLAGRTTPPVLRVTNEKIVLRHIAAVVLSEFFRALGNRQRFETVGSFLEDMRRPHAVSDVTRFVQEHRSDLEARLCGVVPPELHRHLGLRDGNWVQAIMDAQGRLAGAESEVSSDYAKVEDFEEQARNERRYQDADWARRRAETIKGEDVISFLSRKAVIPKYGFPVDVVELDLQRSRTNISQESSEVSLQRDLSIAVAEFAPGCKLVANKKLWTSYGLKRVAEREWGWREYLKCTRHGTFVSWKREDSVPQQPCCDQARRSVYVDPIFGFVAERKAPEDPSYRPGRVYTTRPYFLGPGGMEPETIDMAGIASVRKASPGRLVVLCEGRKGQGFLICPTCGAGMQEQARGHKTPLGRPCNGTPERVALGHEFVTDVLRVRLHHRSGLTGVPDGLLWFGYSLAYSLLHGAHVVLEIPLQDLSVTVRSTEGDEIPEIILYDDVPGGAGLVARLEDQAMFRLCLERARDRIDGSCGCAQDASCYGCLRSYANQFAHPRLRRGPVHMYLNEVLARWNA
ncbi:DEAD/DEAH box helicase [bacterium]|nr:DEAD/DEAH box helicase [bacterium]